MSANVSVCFGPGRLAPKPLTAAATSSWDARRAKGGMDAASVRSSIAGWAERAALKSVAGAGA